ncbi:hypothetical protein [uncultured Dokdonia sp.]|uniref:hypothetical protein n=1 Tax=uncultured Dokdonia sp. TaxID=575653 RepID=UPI002637B106|nr:hypothetical protein [uncultured Dokdonia sp.]
MKSKALILLASVLLLNSCIVKSLQPFYTKGDISYIESLIGKWTDQKNNTWVVTSLREEFTKDQKEGVKLSEEDRKAFETYKDGYLITYTRKNKKAVFIAMPFKIEGQYFLDFILFDFDTESINNLAASHLIKTHSVAKIELDNNKNASFLWLTEEHLKNLFKTDKLRLKHEIIGPDEALLLTASSQELSAFLKKYNTSSIKDKWKSSDTMTLTKNTL